MTLNESAGLNVLAFNKLRSGNKVISRIFILFWLQQIGNSVSQNIKYRSRKLFTGNGCLPFICTQILEKTDNFKIFICYKNILYFRNFVFYCATFISKVYFIHWEKTRPIWLLLITKRTPDKFINGKTQRKNTKVTTHFIVYKMQSFCKLNKWILERQYKWSAYYIC